MLTRILKNSNIMGIMLLITMFLMFGNARTEQLIFYYISISILFIVEVYHFINKHKIYLTKNGYLFKYIIWYFIFTILCMYNVNRSFIVEIAKDNFGFIWKNCVVVVLIVYWYANKNKTDFFDYYILATIYMAIRTFITFIIDYNMDETIQTIGIQYNTIALLCAIGAVISFYYIYINKSNRYKFAFVICCICCLVTMSRKAFLFLIVGIILEMILYAKLSKKIRNIFLIIIGCFVGLFLIYKIPFLYEKFGQRLIDMLGFFTQDTNSEDISVVERVYFYQTAMELFIDNIWFGNGLMSCYSRLLLQQSRHLGYAHNNYLEIASAMGIIGLISFYWLFVYIIIKCIKNYRKLKKSEGLTYFIVFILLCIVQIGQVIYYTNCYIIVILLLAFKLDEKINERE